MKTRSERVKLCGTARFDGAVTYPMATDVKMFFQEVVGVKSDNQIERLSCVTVWRTRRKEKRVAEWEGRALKGSGAWAWRGMRGRLKKPSLIPVCASPSESAASVKLRGNRPANSTTPGRSHQSFSGALPRTGASTHESLPPRMNWLPPSRRIFPWRALCSDKRSSVTSVAANH